MDFYSQIFFLASTKYSLLNVNTIHISFFFPHHLLLITSLPNNHLNILDKAINTHEVNKKKIEKRHPILLLDYSINSIQSVTEYQDEPSN